MKKTIASLVVLLFSFFAAASICMACWWVVYQPEVPQKLQK